MQFPDEMLDVAVDVVMNFQDQIPDSYECNVFLLADSSYGSCCADEVAAEHADSDLIVHFGHSCMSPTMRLPVFNVFENPLADASSGLSTYLLEQVSEKLNSLPELPVLVVYDQHLREMAQSVVLHLSPSFDLHMSQLSSEFVLPSTKPLGEFMPGRKLSPKTPSNLLQSALHILYIGSSSSLLQNLLLRFNTLQIIACDPIRMEVTEESAFKNRLLPKRMNTISALREANAIGILAGTLAVASYADVIEKLAQTINAANKKCFTFVVGKLNPAKLANFPEIDVFVLVSCPECSIIDAKEFSVPIATPYELDIAMRSESFTFLSDSYEFDFTNVIAKLNDVIPSQPDELAEINQSLQLKTQGQVTTTTHADNAMVQSTSWNSLSNRSWRGLDVTESMKKVSLATEGRAGIARGYTHEIRYDD